MGLNLVIVTELLETNNTIEQERNGRIVANIPCNWYRESRLNITQFKYSTGRIYDNNLEHEFTTGEKLIEFGKSLIDTVIPLGLVEEYNEKHLQCLIERIKYAKSMNTNNLKDKITEKIHGSCDINEILEVLTKYQSKINIYKNTTIDECLLPYLDFFEEIGLSSIERMVNFGLEVIEHGKKGYKAYWIY